MLGSILISRRGEAAGGEGGGDLGQCWACPLCCPSLQEQLATHQNSAVEDSKGGVAPLVVVVSTRAVQ